MRLTRVVLGLCLSAVLAACGGGGGSPGSNPNQPNLTTNAPATVTLEPGSAQTFQVFGGVPPYTASSPNRGVALAAIEGNRLTVGAVARGTVAINLTDFSGKSIAVPVSVGALLPLTVDAPPALIVQRGLEQSRAFTINGGIGPYSVTVTDARLLSAAVIGRLVTLTGLNVATTPVKTTVRDAIGNTVDLDVTVAGNAVPLFTSAPGTVALRVGTLTEYAVGGGGPPYSASSSAPAVVQAGVSGGVLSLRALATGSATVSVRDSESAAPVLITVSVANAPLEVAPTAGAGNVGDTLSFAVSGGVLPYSVLSSNTAIASASLSGSTASVRLIATGETNVVVSDAEGKSKSIAVSSANADRTFRLSPSALSIPETRADAIALTISGGTAPYTAFASSRDLASATVSGNTVTVGVGTQGNRCVTTTTAVTVTVVDSVGLSATSTITIDDTGTCP